MTLEGFDRLAQALDRLPQYAVQELSAAMNEAVQVVEVEVKDRTPVGAAGRGSYSKFLAQSIVTEVESDANGATGVVGTNVSYAPCVEYPTQPHWPPVEPIYEWVQHSKKFGVYSIKTRRRMGTAKSIEQENKRITYLVRRKIAKHGTKGAYMFRDGLAAARETVQGIFTRAIDRVVERFRQGA